MGAGLRHPHVAVRTWGAASGCKSIIQTWHIAWPPVGAHKRRASHGRVDPHGAARNPASTRVPPSPLHPPSA
eukprot:358012-Chlamydomonas_euryale.AAC.1